MPAEAIAAHDRANTLRALDLLPVGSKIFSKSAAGFLAVVPPGARAAERLAVSNHSSKKPPLRQQVQAAKPSDLKGSTMPAAVATKPKHNTAWEIKNARTSEAPRHILPTLKAFKGPHAAKNAFAASRVLLAAMGRLIGQRDFIAEAFCNSHGYDVLNVATKSNPTTGGFLTPNPLSAAVVELKAKVGISRQLAEVLPMTSNSASIPKETAGLSVRYPIEGGGGSITPSDLAWGMINLHVEKRAILSFISNELAADAAISFADMFARRAGHALAGQEGNEFINGDGTSSFGGVSGLKGSLGAGGVYSAASGHDTWPELDITDFSGCMGKLPSQFTNGGEAWVCSPQFYGTAMLKAVNGAFQGISENGRPLFLGKEVFLTSKAPTATAAAPVACYYGSFAEAVMIGDRVDFALKTSEHTAFAQDLTALLGAAKYDLVVHEGGDATTAGAYVG